VLLKQKQLPLALLGDSKDKGEGSNKIRRAHLLGVSPFGSTFGKNKTRKKPTLSVEDYSAMVSKVPPPHRSRKWSDRVHTRGGKERPPAFKPPPRRQAMPLHGLPRRQRWVNRINSTCMLSSSSIRSTRNHARAARGAADGEIASRRRRASTSTWRRRRRRRWCAARTTTP
jgi:hypothetical protein